MGTRLTAASYSDHTPDTRTGRRVRRARGPALCATGLDKSAPHVTLWEGLVSPLVIRCSGERFSSAYPPWKFVELNTGQGWWSGLQASTCGILELLMSVRSTLYALHRGLHDVTDCVWRTHGSSECMQFPVCLYTLRDDRRSSSMSRHTSHPASLGAVISNASERHEVTARSEPATSTPYLQVSDPVTNQASGNGAFFSSLFRRRPLSRRNSQTLMISCALAPRMAVR